MSIDNTGDVFAVFQKYMEEEENVREEIRTKVKELDQASREIITVLQNVHKPRGLFQTSDIVEKAKNLYGTVRQSFSDLQKLVPADEFYRYHDHWRFTIQRLIFSAAFIVFLESGKLLTRQEASAFLGISANPSDNFHIELDDFLHGLLLVADELSRLSLNCATHGDYKKPVEIAEFVSELNAGFRLLNLKNDSLRKKFDGLKYCLKKVEEVVYDLSIRGLKSAEGPTGEPNVA